MAKASPELVALRKACKEAAKKVRQLSDAKVCRNLQDAGLDALDAYKLGVEECQGSIVQRLLALVVQQQSADDRSSLSRSGSQT